MIYVVEFISNHHYILWIRRDTGNYMKIRKRTDVVVDFDTTKIAKAIQKAMAETPRGIDIALANQIAEAVKMELIAAEKDVCTVDEIQDMVEDHLMLTRRDVAKLYILYRYERDRERKQKEKEDFEGNAPLLKDEFIAKYKHEQNPMAQLGNFVYYRTYSRHLPEENRREYWYETVKRAVEYNCSIVPGVPRPEVEKLYDNIYNLKQFLAGRTFWAGGTEASKKYPMSNFNCAAMTIDEFTAYGELFYLLMVGAGVGVRVLAEDVKLLPAVRTDMEIIHKANSPVAKDERVDHTSMIFSRKNAAEIIVGDSKEGWKQALDYFFNLHHSQEYRDIDTIVINYNHVRPKGERLKIFGGTASGHESLHNMFVKIEDIFKKCPEKYLKLRPIDCLDIANIIGENVVSGGVRRTAEMIMIDPEDHEAIEAKNNLYIKNAEGNWTINPDISHRTISNNSIFYTEKPSREKLHWQIEQMRYSGEPGFVNQEAAAKRRPNFKGTNPCGEILLDSKGLCNLTSVNVMAFVKDGGLDYHELATAMELSARAGLRMTCLDLELYKWDLVQKRDRLIGCSLTGWQDAMNAIGYGPAEQAKLLRQLREVVHSAGRKYSRELGIEEPLLMTTVKPEGTQSQLPTVSSGVHFSHSPYYIRRVRISADDPLSKVAMQLGWPVLPENGQEWANATTYVIEFPVKAPGGLTKKDVSAIEQLEIYKMFMTNYVDHNCSITVHVKDDEWDLVEEWVWNNWDDTVALSFLSFDDSFYELLPYEEITKEEYEKRLSAMAPFIPSLISKFESSYKEYDLDTDCAAGICPVR